MGRPKGSLVLDGLTLAERAARELRPLCGSVLISLAPGMANPARKYPVVEDSPPAFRGPLAGIDAAMGVTGEADLLVLACDYPGIDTGILRRLLGAAQAEDDVVFLVDPEGRDHPLVGLWKRSARGQVQEALEYRMYKVRGLLADLAARRLGPAELPDFDLATALANLNEPEGLEEGGG
jgi:molybdopterin-guanine dinucleotide biosynthesis protein A